MGATEPGRSTYTVARFAIAFLALLLAFDVAWFVLVFARHWVNEDHSLFWYAARDLGHFEFPQPNYYGAAYFSVFEAAPAEVLRRLGVPLGTGVPLSTTVLMVAGWPLLAFAAWRRRQPVLSVAALAVPLAISNEFLVSAESPGGRGAGTFLAVVGVAVLLLRPTAPINVGIFALFGGMGVVWDFGSAFLVVPVGVYALLVNGKDRNALVAGAVGLMPSAAWLLYQRAFYGAHGDYNLHRGEGFTPSFNVLSDTIADPSRYFDWLAPELLRTWILPVGAALVLLVALIRTRRPALFLPGIALVTLVVVALASPKALDGTPSVYVGHGRYFLAVPAALWFLWFILADVRPWRDRVQRGVVVGIAAFAVVTFCVRHVQLQQRLGDIREVAAGHVGTGAPVFPAADLETRCRQVDALVEQADVELAVFRGDRVGAYACAALHYDEFETLHPAYDRRTWLMHDAQREPVAKFVVTDVDEDWCEQAEEVVERCTVDPQYPTLAVVETAPIPVLETWNALGEEIRPLGDELD